MGDPYRDNHHRCPVCPESTLRAHATRFVCDACGGMLVELPDLGGAIRDLTGLDAAFAFVDDRASKRTCPRCPQTLTACRLRITIDDHTFTTGPVVDRCEHHGVWFDAEELAAVFAKVRRKVGGGTAGGGGVGMTTGITGTGGRSGWWPGA